MNSVEQAFSKFDCKTKQKLYLLLEIEYRIKKEEIPGKISDFASALEKMLGVSAILIEIYILKNIHQAVPSFICDIDCKNFSFPKYIELFEEYIKFKSSP